MKIPFVQFNLYSKAFTEPVLQGNDHKDSNKHLQVIQTNSRSSTIVPAFIGKVLSIYNGKKSQKIKITSDMLGYKLGCFVFTKKLGKSIHNSDKNKKKIIKMKRKITQKKVRKTSPTKAKISKKSKKLKKR